MLRLLFSFFLLLTCLKAFTQDSTSVQKTTKKSLPVFVDNRLFNGIRFGADVAGIAYGYIIQKETFKINNRYEINADFGIKRWFINLDAGMGDFIRKQEAYPDYKYKSSGQYFRLGADYRISKSAKSFLFFGGRFAQGFFQEEGTYYIPGVRGSKTTIIRDQLAGDFNRKFTVNWIELTPGIKVYLWKNFYMGYTIRAKFLIPSKKLEELVPLDIPGYGVYRNTNIGFSFHLMYRIPFGKDPEIPLKGR